MSDDTCLGTNNANVAVRQHDKGCPAAVHILT